MQKEIKFYMLTILKDDNLFANIYDKYDDFIGSLESLRDKYPLRAWELVKTMGDKFDLIVTKDNNSYVACLEPKREISDDEKDFVKCIKKEIDTSRLKSSGNR